MSKRLLALAKGASHTSNLNQIDRRLASGWLRMGQLPIGATLTRTLIKDGHLDSIVVASPGSKRGVRLVSQESLDRYFKSLLAQQKEEVVAQ
jgi:hypothetical protein